MKFCSKTVYPVYYYTIRFDRSAITFMNETLFSQRKKNSINREEWRDNNGIVTQIVKLYLKDRYNSILLWKDKTSYFFLSSISSENFFTKFLPRCKTWLSQITFQKLNWKVEKLETLNIKTLEIFISKNLHKPRDLSKSVINSNIKCSRNAIKR